MHIVQYLRTYLHIGLYIKHMFIFILHRYVVVDMFKIRLSSDDTKVTFCQQHFD